MPEPIRHLDVGVGFRPGTGSDAIVRAVREVLGDNPIRCLATIDRRAAEPGFTAAARELRVPTQAFTPAELAAVEVPNPAQRTAAALVTASVAEAAALLACGTGHLVITKTVVESVTVAAARGGPAERFSARP
jgi:cobalamin biosynthesis protein CbiG